MTATDTYLNEIETWRAKRLERLQAEDGWLNIIGRWPLNVGQTRIGSARNNDIVLDVGPANLGRITLAEDGALSFIPENGEALDLPRGQGGRFTADRLLVEIIRTGDETALRIRDRKSPLRQSVKEIPHFPVDPAWKVTADWIELDQPFKVSVDTFAGTQVEATVRHKAVFHHRGEKVELYPTHGTPEAPHFIFRDQTAGETYPAARFLFAAPKGSQIVLDFNTALNPPCSFSAFTTCPFPIAQNVLPFRIEAGELRVPDNG